MTPERRGLLLSTRNRLQGMEADLEALMVEARLEGTDQGLAYRVRGYVNAARRALLSAADELSKEVEG